MKDDPGRQAIGSFNPLTPDDWTEMAYVGNTALLCQAIVDGDIECVNTWLKQEGNDPNTRDYTGRAPLHLAVANSTLDVVQALIDHNARLVARLVDGKTALHLAAMRGSVEMVSALLRKSEANEEEDEEKVDARRAARKAAKERTPGDVTMQDANQTHAPSAGAEDDSDVEMIEEVDASEDEKMDATTENSMVNIKPPAREADDQALANEESDDGPDVYNQDVVAWDVAVSPLHLAIVKGHVEVVKCLVQEFGADTLLPIKLFNDDKSAKAAILTLVLALQLPAEKAEEMARTLIQLGASSAQASIDQSTALQSCVGDRPDLLDTIAEADATGVMRAINHLSVSGHRWSVQVTSPLMTAIHAKDSLTALRLLGLGAKPEVDFGAYMKAYQTRHEPLNDSKYNKRNFEQSLEQPVLSAVRCELPLVAKSLVESYGVDPNTLTTEGYRVLNDEYSWSYTKGQSLLDKVQEKLKSLRNWEYKVEEPKAPEPLKDDAQYLSGFKQGSYALLSARTQLSVAKDGYERDLKSYKEKIQEQKDRSGVIEKQDAINRMIGGFEQLETALLDKGAKGFRELHPDTKEPEKRDSPSYHRHQHKPGPFQIELRFQIGDLTEESQKRYERLFEAAWNGDTRAVKDLTLNPWTDEKDDDHPPSRVAIKDQHNLSPFSIAILRGHYDLATAIMDIASAQHVSADQPKKKRYGIDAGDSDDESGGEDDGVQLYSEIVDDDFTIETIGEVSTQVKSRVLPVEMLQWASYLVSDFVKAVPGDNSRASSSGFSYFGPRRPSTMTRNRTNTGNMEVPTSHSLTDQTSRKIPKPTSLLQFAVYTNDHKLLTLLLELGRDYTRAQPEQEEEAAKRAYSIPDQDFDYALEVGHTHLLTQIIKYTGAGIPLNSLAKKYGADLKEKPRYYQGLSVYGTKRKDWADAGHSHTRYKPAQKHLTPLLSSAYFGSLEAVEWFLSDTPMRCYKEFEEANKDDKRLQRLALSDTGFAGSVEKFLAMRSYLAIHCCIMGKKTAESYSLLQYLLESVSDSIESKSIEGYTPLQVAFELYREDAAKTLIQAGADQTCRDRSGRNLLHSLLSRSFEKHEHIDQLRTMLDLIDKRVLPTLFVERSTGSLTPLHSFLHNRGYEHDDKVLKEILEYGRGEELRLISGDGHTPLHTTVQGGDLTLTRIILEHDPTLINRENATGRTPYEMAEDTALASVCNNPPPMPSGHDFTSRRAMRYGLQADWATDILDRSPKSFVEGVIPVEVSEREKIWNLLQETMVKLHAEGNSKRRLVTLNEANEVAKRLAAMKAGPTRDLQDDESALSDQEDEEHYGDEVKAYLGRAKSRM